MNRKFRFFGMGIVVPGMMLASASMVHAENMEVTIIGGPEEGEEETVSLDDIKLNKEIEIENYALLLPTSFEYIDILKYFEVEYDYDYGYGSYESGTQADYAVLYMDITNTKTSPKDYFAQTSVKVTFDGKYEYEGWYYQFDYDKTKDGEEVAQKTVIKPDQVFPIEPMYTGHYVFGCTLPNSVVKSKAPLSMQIEIDGNEITYNIRK